MAFPNGLPPGSVNYPQQPQQQFGGYYPPQPYYPPMPPTPQIGTPQYQAFAAEAEKRRLEEELRALRDDATRREREATLAKHAAELTTERQANDQRTRALESQMADLRGLIANLSTTLQTGAAKNPEIEAMKEQNRMLAEKMERDRQATESERRDRETRDLIRSMNEQTQKQIELMARQFDERTRALADAAQQRGPDPMIAVFQENSRQQIEAQKELARNATQQLQQMQTMMMNPREMMAMAREQSAGVDQATDKMTKLFGGVVDMQQKVMENALQMQPGGSGVVDIVRDGVNGLKEFADRYVGAKSAENRIAMNAQVAIAEAQARAVASAHQPTVTVTPSAPPPQPYTPTMGGLNGAPPDAAAPAPAPSGKRRLGRTDAEWFGPMLTEVEQLRDAVAEFHAWAAAHTADPAPDPNAKPSGAMPEHTVMAIIQAVQILTSRGINVPVMVDLMAQSRFADFVDVLIPDASQAYRDDVVQILTKQISAMTGEEVKDAAAGGDGDNGDDDSDGDDDGETVEAAPVPKAGKNGVTIKAPLQVVPASKSNPRMKPAS